MGRAATRHLRRLPLPCRLSGDHNRLLRNPSAPLYPKEIDSRRKLAYRKLYRAARFISAAQHDLAKRIGEIDIQRAYQFVGYKKGDGLGSGVRVQRHRTPGWW